MDIDANPDDPPALRKARKILADGRTDLAMKGGTALTPTRHPRLYMDRGDTVFRVGPLPTLSMPSVPS